MASSSHKELFPVLSVNNKAFPISAFFRVLCVVPSYLLTCARLRENKVKTCRAYFYKTVTLLMGEASCQGPGQKEIPALRSLKNKLTKCL